MTHYHNNYALVQCIDPTTYKVRQEDPQQFEVDGEWIDLLPFWRWECLGTSDVLGEDQAVHFVEWCDNMDGLFYKDYTADKFHMRLHSALSSFASLLRSLNLDPARCLVFKQMEK